MNFADRIHQRITSLKSHLVVGIDPDPSRVIAPTSAFARAFPSEDPETILENFCRIVLEAARHTACAVKPQVAFFESMGIMGWRVLAKCIKQARNLGIPVILDAKRGDIGSTAQAYARAYLDPSSDFYADALTVNPFLGPDTLEPFVRAASASGSGLFILVKTSNPGSVALQDAVLGDGSRLCHKVARMVDELAQQYVGECGYSTIGAVVGATYPEDVAALRQVMPRSILLVPGYGAQGATASDVKAAFNQDGHGAVVNASRSIIFAYEKREHPDREQIFQAVAEAAQAARDDIEQAISRR